MADTKKSDQQVQLLEKPVACRQSIWTLRKTGTRDLVFSGSFLFCISCLLLWGVSLSLSAHRPTKCVWGVISNSRGLNSWLCLPKTNPICSPDNHSKNLKVGFHLSHLVEPTPNFGSTTECLGILLYSTNVALLLKSGCQGLAKESRAVG